MRIAKGVTKYKNKKYTDGDGKKHILKNGYSINLRKTTLEKGIEATIEDMEEDNHAKKEAKEK